MKILDIWITNRDTGAVLLHKNYSGIEFVRSELFGSITSVIFNWNFSENQDEQAVSSIEIGNKGLHFSLQENSALIIIAVEAGFERDKLSHLFDKIFEHFVLEGFCDKLTDYALNTDEYLKFIPTMDKLIEDFEKKLQVSPPISVEDKIKDVLQKVVNGEVDSSEASELIKKLKG